MSLSGFAVPAEGDESRRDLRTVLFGSLDAGRSTFGSVGLKRTLAGPLDADGPVAMAIIGFGPTDRGSAPLSGRPAALRHAGEGSALLGRQWALERTHLAFFLGPEFAAGQDGSRRRAGDASPLPRFGTRLQGELWAHPTETTLLTATLVAGTARHHLWGRIAAGRRIWSTVFVGPEASLYRTGSYRELRLGLHATGLHLGRVHLRLSGGWRWDDDSRGRGGYFGLSGYLKL